MEFAMLWFALAVIVGVAAGRRSRSGILWFVQALLISPLLSGLLLLALGVPASESAIVIEGQAATPETHVRCPDCRELVRRDARRCKHCGVALVPQ